MGQRAVLVGRISKAPQRRDGNPPRVVASLCDDDAREVGFTLFGASGGALAGLRPGYQVRISGVLQKLNQRWWLRSADLVLGGAVDPVYPAIYGSAAKTRAMIRRALPVHVRSLAGGIAAKLSRYGDPAQLLAIAGCARFGIEELLRSIHAPHGVEEALACMAAIDRISALLVILEAREHLRQQRRPRWSGPVAEPQYWQDRLPFALNEDQHTAIHEIVCDLRAQRPMRRLLVGEIGTGKTAVFVVSITAALMGGGRVAVLLASDVLATALFQEIVSWFPELGPNVALVSGSHSVPDLERYPLVLGTAALLARDAAKRDFVVIDDPQQCSRSQRDTLSRQGVHTLEVSATPIPRTQALLQLGFVDVSRLRQRHADRAVITRLWARGDRRELFAQIRQTLIEGGQALIVYPRRNGDRASVEGAYPGWESHFPGRVRFAHSGLDGIHIRRVLDDLSNGSADILITSTLIETGLDLPRLRHALVVDPHRYTLMQLHQLRARVAQTGGEGAFDLLVGANEPPSAMGPFRILLESEDGFAIAQKDLELRGDATLASCSDRQDVTGRGLLVGRPIAAVLLEEMLESVTALV